MKIMLVVVIFLALLKAYSIGWESTKALVYLIMNIHTFILEEK